jgi:hypothetical protein
LVSELHSDNPDYRKFQKYIKNKYERKGLLGWSLDVDDQTGSFEWVSPNDTASIYANPFNYDDEELPIQLDKNVNGERDGSGAKMIKNHSFQWKGDIKKTEAEYLKILTPYLKKIFKIIKISF